MPLTYCRQLHRDNRVNFAGYKVPHPLEYRMLIKVHSSSAHNGGGCGHNLAIQDGFGAELLQTICCVALLQVQTNGECEPKAAMQDALQDLQNEFGEIAASFAVSPGAEVLQSTAIKHVAKVNGGNAHSSQIMSIKLALRAGRD